MLLNVGAIHESPLYANPKAPLRVSVGELSCCHAKHGSMTEGAGSKRLFTVCIPANSGIVTNSPCTHAQPAHHRLPPPTPFGGHLKVNCPEGAREATLGCPLHANRGRGGFGAAAPVLLYQPKNALPNPGGRKSYSCSISSFRVMPSKKSSIILPRRVHMARLWQLRSHWASQLTGLRSPSVSRRISPTV